MSEKEIEFKYTAGDEPDSQILPIPAHENIPDWFMRTPAIFDPGSKTGTTVKLCRAFTDALHLGYIIPSPEDITINRSTDGTIQSESSIVDVYGNSPIRSERNSMYPMPEVKIGNPWEITTPEGYSTLLMKPLNRSLKGFEANAMLVPTDTYDGPINIPAVMGGDSHEIKKGEPLLHAIPLKREELLKPKEVREANNPELFERCEKIRSQLSSRKDLYRKVYHQEKPKGEVVVKTNCDLESDSNNNQSIDSPALEGLGERSETHDEHFLFITKDEDWNVTPGPYKAIEKAPPWVGDLTKYLSSSTNTAGGDDEQLFDEWIRAACSIGGIDVAPVDVEVDQEGDYEDRSSHSRFDAPVVKPSVDEKIGPEFPYDMNTTGVSTNRFVASVDGYSTLLVDPLNHYQQYIRGAHGVVDHDVYYDVSNMPSFIFTNNPELTIRKGDPTMQTIPFRRESLITNAVVKY